MRTSPFFGSGTGSSASFICSGSHHSLTCQAFIRRIALKLFGFLCSNQHSLQPRPFLLPLGLPQLLVEFLSPPTRASIVAAFPYLSPRYVTPQRARALRTDRVPERHRERNAILPLQMDATPGNLYQ